MSYANYEGQKSQYEQVLTVVLSGSHCLLRFFAAERSVNRSTSFMMSNANEKFVLFCRENVENTWGSA